MDWSSFAGNIDLTLFNIRYEIECNWNYSDSVYPPAFIHIAPNNITASDYQSDSNTSSTFVGGVTNWTNIMSGDTWGTTQEFNQSYRNRFMCGFAHQISGSLTEYRCRTILNGEMMLQTRPTGQSGITDPSPEERNIFNRFTCNNYTTQRVSGNWHTYNVFNYNDIQNSHMRIDGTAIFGAQSFWNEFLASGINRIGLRLNDGFNVNDTRPRGAHYIYRIYRVRK